MLDKATDDKVFFFLSAIVAAAIGLWGSRIAAALPPSRADGSRPHPKVVIVVRVIAAFVAVAQMIEFWRAT